jgi:hypothetical protein
MIKDDFSSIDVPSVAGDAARWDWTTDSDETANFIAGSLQDVELEPDSGTVFLAHVTEPTKIHQLVEIKVIFGSVPGSTCHSGAFARYTDADNFVMVRIDHNARDCKLIETIAGAATTLATAPLTASGDITGASARIEIIGKRARIWYEPHYRDVPDEPPDIAADLAGDYGDTPGEWGIYLNCNSNSSNARVTNFMARELPSKCLPPPHLIAAIASGYNLVPITATASSVNASAGSLEWEIYPVDADDFAEAYKDTAVASITTRIFFVRAGFTYDVRVRELKKNGGNNAWTSFSRVTASGSKVAPDSPTMPDIDFPESIVDGINILAPDYVLDRTQASDVSAVVSDTGRPRLTSTYTRPPNSFNLIYHNRPKDGVQPLIDFFEEMRGSNTPFKWVHPISGEQFAMHFSKDDYEYVPKDSTPVGEEGVIGDMSIEISEVVVGGVGTLSVTLTVDPALLGE